jgi:hypothetical protein
MFSSNGLLELSIMTEVITVLDSFESPAQKMRRDPDG